MIAAGVVAGVSQRIDAGIFFAFVFALYTLKRGRAGVVIIVIVGAASYSWGYLSSAQWTSARAHFQQHVSAGRRIDGVAISPPRVSLYGATFRFRSIIDDESLTMQVQSPYRAVNVGDSLRLRITPRRERPGSEGFLRGRSLCGAVRVRSGGLRYISDDRSEAAPIVRLKQFMRVRLSRRLSGWDGIFVALLLGERGQLQRSVTPAFRKLGISHLLALSGMHLGLILAALLTVSRVLTIRSSMLVGVVITGYVILVGDAVSLWRAWLMIVWWLSVRYLHRPVQSGHALLSAAVILLLSNPQLLFAVGFQLSVLATAGVLYAIHHIGKPERRDASRLRRVIVNLGNMLWIGVMAQVVTFPLQAHHFGAVSLVAPLATIAFLPAIALFFLLAALVVTVPDGPLADGAAWISVSLARWFQHVLMFAADHAPALWDPTGADPWLLGAGLLLLTLRPFMAVNMVGGILLIVIAGT